MTEYLTHFLYITQSDPPPDFDADKSSRLGEAEHTDTDSPSEAEDDQHSRVHAARIFAESVVGGSAEERAAELSKLRSAQAQKEDALVEEKAVHAATAAAVGALEAERSSTAAEVSPCYFHIIYIIINMIKFSEVLCHKCYFYIVFYLCVFPDLFNLFLVTILTDEHRRKGSKARREDERAARIARSASQRLHEGQASCTQ